MGLKKQAEERQEEHELEIRKTKMPRGNQVFGIVEQRLGGTRMKVRCLDRKNRLCRIPGRFKRKLWVREGDTVLVEPWELSGDEKGDIIFKYRKAQIEWLRKTGALKQMEELDEF